MANSRRTTKQLRKAAEKRLKFKAKYQRKHRLISHHLERQTRMSITHTNDITKKARAVAKWLHTRPKPPFPSELRDYVLKRFPQHGAEDRQAIVAGALAFWKRDHPETYDKWVNQGPDVEAAR